MNENSDYLLSILRKESTASRGIFVLALILFLYYASSLLVPLFLAFLFYFLFNPFVRFLRYQFYIPLYVGSAIAILILLIIVGIGFFYLSLEIKSFINNEQMIISGLTRKIELFSNFLKRPIEIFTDLKERIKYLLNLSIQPNVTPNIFGSLFSNTYEILLELGMWIILLYFLLASGDIFLNKIIKSLLATTRKSDAIKIARLIEVEVWRYLFLRTVINLGFGVVVSLFLYLFGFPNPLFWGLLAGILEFIPFIGAGISLVLILIVSILSFENIWYILSVPFIFFVLVSIEGNFIAPYVMGRSLVLNKVALVLGIFFFGWTWGVLGTFLAVPLMMTFKIILENVDQNHFLNEILSE